MVCLSISDPTVLDLPKAEADKVLALNKEERRKGPQVHGVNAPEYAANWRAT